MEKILKDAFEAGRVYQAMANSTAGILGFNEAPDFDEWYKILASDGDLASVSLRQFDDKLKELKTLYDDGYTEPIEVLRSHLFPDAS